MSIQAGWNQALLTAGALGKLGEQNKLHEYNNIMNLQQKLQDKMGPIHDDYMAKVDQSRMDYEKAKRAVDPNTPDFADTLKRMQTEYNNIIASETEAWQDARKKAITEFNFENAVDQMPRNMLDSLDKADKSYADYVIQQAKDLRADRRNRINELGPIGLSKLPAQGTYKAHLAEMAAQKAQDAAQTADMQPKNSMSPIIEQLRRNTQNAVKGGTK